MPKKTLVDFIINARQTHGNKYDYSKSTYFGATKPIQIYCKECKNYFSKTPNKHISSKQGCPSCSKKHMYSLKRKSPNSFIKQSKTIHGDKYNYDNVVYINNKTNVSLFCKTCNKSFDIKPDEHLRKETATKKPKGCPTCGIKQRSDSNRKTINDFIYQSREIHGDKYNYDNVVYKNTKTPVKIWCNKHKEFFSLRPSDHIHQNQGCRKCNFSKGENKISEYLTKKNIQYDIQKKYQFLGRNIKFDFYLPQYNLYIEFDGKQHFDNWHFGKKEHQISNDSFKNVFIAHKNKTLLRIHYKDLNKIEKIIDEYLNKKLKSNIYFSRKAYNTYNDVSFI